MRHSLQRLVPILGLTLIICALAAFTVVSSSLAQTRGKAACSPSATHHARGHHPARTCTSHHGKPHHTSKQHPAHTRTHTSAKHKHKHKARSPHTHTVQAARCEDGSAPSADEEGGFACADGSEPECENGSAPTLKGQHLVCASLVEDTESADEASCEELEELEGDCSSELDAQDCEAAQAACEGQS